MPLGIWHSRICGAQHCCQEPEGFRAALIIQRSTVHLGREALSLARDGFGGTSQRLLRQSELQVIGQLVPLNGTVRGGGNENGDNPIWRLRPILAYPS